MAVTFVSASAETDSGGIAVTGIDVDRTAISLVTGDYCLIWGWVNTTVDWDIPDGADGNPWTKLWKYDRFQVWGKFLGSGFGTSVTHVDFSGGRVVFGMQQAFWRGAGGLSWNGAVTGSGHNVLQSPSAFPTGTGGRVARLFSLSPSGIAGGSVTVTTPSGNTSRAFMGTGSPPSAFTTFLCDKSYTGSGNVGTAATVLNTGSVASERRYNLGSALTVIFNENLPPNAPTLVSPAPDAVLNVAVSQTFTWIHNDPEGDPQSGFTLRYRIALSGDPWTVVTHHTDSRQFVVIPDTDLAVGDYEWQVSTSDRLGNAGPSSTSRFFTLADMPDVPTIDYPASGGTVSRLDRVDWTFTDQEDYEVRRVADDIDGNPDTGTIYEDFTSTDFIDAADTRTYPLTFDTNGRYEHIQVRCKLSGFWSDWADVRVFVSYVEPPTADLQVFEGDDGASIELIYATPAADPGITDQPDATSVTLRYSTDGGETFTPYRSGLPVSGTDVYDRPASGLDYCFSVQAFADNGTASVTEWISRARLTIDEVL